MIDCQKNYGPDLTKDIVEVLKAWKPIVLDQDQLVYEAINIMATHHCKSLPLQRDGRCIGTIRMKDLIRFIEAGPTPEVICHKLNYTLYSALHIISKGFKQA
ncbi:signal-transduction protein with cAMP-binding, CBS, and nucleotidyltransferase domain [Pedobacter africanus]|uniref:Signal-transduction protein with cAMP-binding, CBS, and nucleotidyltransferase domain n=1 Tax=Pedobacter africanus TaxID=151894 RepID=A0ACC6KUM2_9SPHI|nr:CBS domain-containing protein [Pedobacter africanus]MDR6782834.1 signal-transduction protein with cAMP-binding, CBS, and nucleotidyltransferase domain [Pedobacter africanus]